MKSFEFRKRTFQYGDWMMINTGAPHYGKYGSFHLSGCIELQNPINGFHCWKRLKTDFKKEMARRRAKGPKLIFSAVLNFYYLQTPKQVREDNFTTLHMKIQLWRNCYLAVKTWRLAACFRRRHVQPHLHAPRAAIAAVKILAGRSTF